MEEKEEEEPEEEKEEEQEERIWGFRGEDVRIMTP